jgi:microcystin degradation protein MlrC
VPLLAAMAQPSGVIQRSVFDTITAEILDGLKNSDPLDAIFLDLLGAGVVEGVGQKTHTTIPNNSL